MNLALGNFERSCVRVYVVRLSGEFHTCGEDRAVAFERSCVRHAVDLRVGCMQGKQ